MFEPVRFDNGVGIRVLSTGGEDVCAVRVARLPYRDYRSDYIDVAGGWCTQERKRGLWGSPSDEARLHIAGTTRTTAYPYDTFTEYVADEAHGPAGSMGPAQWFATGVLDDGTEVVVGGEMLGVVEPTQIYAVVQGKHGTQVMHAGRAERTAPLPVRVELPDQQGWVVAAYGAKLRYRGADGSEWSRAVEDAALLPPTATEVEVTGPDGRHVVRL